MRSSASDNIRKHRWILTIYYKGPGVPRLVSENEALRERGGIKRGAGDSSSSLYFWLIWVADIKGEAPRGKPWGILQRFSYKVKTL